MAYAYNAQGIRTAKRVNNTRTAFVLDGGNVVAEVRNNTVIDNYLRGVNLIRRTSSSETEYYIFNAHGDVVSITNLNGTVNQSYDYDAFGSKKALASIKDRHRAEWKSVCVCSWLYCQTRLASCFPASIVSAQ